MPDISKLQKSKILNQKLFRISHFVFRACLVFQISYFVFPHHVLASTEPQSTNPSVTATIPLSSSTTADTTAPPPVVLIAPHDGAVTNTRRPELTWVQTFDNNSNTVYYRVKLNGTTTFLGVSNTGNSQQHNYIAHIGDGRVYLTPTFDLTEGVYDWSVEAYDGSGNTSYSTTWRFTIDITPPTLVITNIDDTYLYPNIIDGSSFDLPGPQTVALTFLTEPWATVSLTVILPAGTQYSLSLPTQESGLITTALNLPLGLTQLNISSFDSAGLTTTLPLFYLNLTSTPLTALTITDLPQKIATIPYYTLDFVTTLPATVSQITSSDYIIVYIYILLAIAIIILLIIVWHRRFNILIIDVTTNKPFRSLIVYHSRPNRAARFRTLAGRLYITNRSPVLYNMGRSDDGRLYIRGLGRYSSLTIRTPAGTTHILSLSVEQKSYSITI